MSLSHDFKTHSSFDPTLHYHNIWYNNEEFIRFQDRHFETNGIPYCYCYKLMYLFSLKQARQQLLYSVVSIINIIHYNLFG